MAPLQRVRCLKIVVEDDLAEFRKVRPGGAHEFADELLQIAARHVFDFASGHGGVYG